MNLTTSVILTNSARRVAFRDVYHRGTQLFIQRAFCLRKGILAPHVRFANWPAWAHLG
jgi:hypothetical protein